jgi:N-acetylglucosamine kinase-like BadF-type ATPase
MSIYLAVDAGGTKTRCWVADQTRVLADVTARTVKIMNIGETEATARLRDLVNSALQQAGVAPQSVARTCVGLAGLSSGIVRQWADATLSSLVSGQILLCGDEEIALEAGCKGGPGVLVIAGTGSNVVGRCSDGTVITVGGWGPMIGDEGSGTWIGQQAIRAALHSRDRDIDTCLLPEIEKFWGVEDIGALVAKANQRPRPDYAELTPVVVKCAAEGDALAEGVLRRAGEELADQVTLAVTKMHHAGCPSGEIHRIDFTGSVLGMIPQVRQAMKEQLAETLPGVAVSETAVEPLEGALWKVRQN